MNFYCRMDRAGSLQECFDQCKDCAGTMVYLASPYTDPDPFKMLWRFDTICCVAAKLMAEGVHLFCPIAHTHPIAVKGSLPRHFDFWEQYDRKMLAACKELWVCTMEGWRESKGVTAEIRIAQELGMPIKYVEPI
jgi:hypothetical protein